MALSRKQAAPQGPSSGTYDSDDAVAEKVRVKSNEPGVERS
jgi:hypothetical protein